MTVSRQITLILYSFSNIFFETAKTVIFVSMAQRIYSDTNRFPLFIISDYEFLQIAFVMTMIYVDQGMHFVLAGMDSIGWPLYFFEVFTQLIIMMCIEINLTSNRDIIVRLQTWIRNGIINGRQDARDRLLLSFKRKISRIDKVLIVFGLYYSYELISKICMPMMVQSPAKFDYENAIW